MPHQILDLISRPARIRDIAPEGVLWILVFTALGVLYLLPTLSEWSAGWTG